MRPGVQFPSAPPYKEFSEFFKELRAAFKAQNVFSKD
jgi:hypothetical protein